MTDDYGAENLEDGELWLPPDFFSMDEVQVPNDVTTPLACCSSSKSNLSCMECFHCIPSSAFIQRNPHNRGLCESLQALQRFKPALRYGFTGFSGNGAQNACDCVTGKGWTGRCSSIHQLQRLNPVPKQIETFMGERARALQRQLQYQFHLNRVSPRLGIGAHGGTGVFLPRISTNMATVTKNHNLRFVGKGPRANNSREFELPSQRINSINRRDDLYCNYAEVGIPNNWYY